MSVFGNRGTRGIFGADKDEVIGAWKKLQNEDLPNVYP
jgi:hypothetical protein